MPGPAQDRDLARLPVRSRPLRLDRGPVTAKNSHPCFFTVPPSPAIAQRVPFARGVARQLGCAKNGAERAHFHGIFLGKEAKKPLVSTQGVSHTQSHASFTRGEFPAKERRERPTSATFVTCENVPSKSLRGLAWPSARLQSPGALPPAWNGARANLCGSQQGARGPEDTRQNVPLHLARHEVLYYGQSVERCRCRHMVLRGPRRAR